MDFQSGSKDKSRSVENGTREAKAKFEMREAERPNAIEDENYKSLTPQEAAEKKLKVYEKALQMLDEASRERDSGNRNLAL
jgi:hypothetical protein